MGIDETRREEPHEARGKNTHEASAHHEARIGTCAHAVLLQCCREHLTPFLARAVVARSNNEGGHSRGLRVGEAGRLSVATDRDDAARKPRLRRCVKQSFEITAPTGDEDRDFQHLTSLPAVNHLDCERERTLGREVRLLPVSYTHLRDPETVLDLVCRLLLAKNKTTHSILQIG